MKPFPDLIVSPSTAHRIPRSNDAESLIHKLLDLEVNAYAFLMDEDLLAEIEAKGFQNDPNRAHEDLMAQLPSHIHAALLPQAPPSSGVSYFDFDDEDEDEGRDSPLLKAKFSSHDLPQYPSRLKKKSEDFELER